MPVRGNVLICNKDGGIGLAVEEIFTHTELHIYNCTMYPYDLKANLKRRKHEVVVLFCSQNVDQVIYTIESIKEEHPETEVIVVMHLRWVSYHEKFFLRGASLCVWLDETPPTRLASYIRLMIFKKEFPDVDLNIAAYLTARGLTGGNRDIKKGNRDIKKGLYYLCTAIKICMDEPEAVKKITKNVYAATAEKCGAPSVGSVSQAFWNLFVIVENSPDLDRRIKRRWSNGTVREKRKSVSERFKDVLWLYQGSV